MQKLKRHLILSQINLFVWLGLSSVLVSSVVVKNGGVSNYGNYYSTFVFYSIAFLASSTYIYLAAESILLLNKKFKNLSRYLYLLSLLLILVFISTFPRRFGDVFSDIHDNISKVLFAYEFLLVAWALKRRPKLDTIFFTLIMASGSIIALLSSMHKLNLMFAGQMLGAFGFALILTISLPKIISDGYSSK